MSSEGFPTGDAGASPEILALLAIAVAVLVAIAVNRQFTVRKLRASEQAFRDLYENVNEGIFRSTLAGRMISANPYLVRLNGFESEADMLREVNDIAGQWYVDPNRRSEIHAMLLEHGQVRNLISEVYRYRTRERIWIEENTRLVRDPRSGKPLYYDGAVREVTETVRRLELQHRYDKIAAVTSGCLYQHRLSPDGKSSMPYASRGLIDLFGVEPEQVARDSSLLGRLIHLDDMPRIVDGLNRAASSLTAWQCEYRVIVPGQPERWVFAHAFPEREPDGSTLWHGFLSDVSERKRSEARIHTLAYFDALTGLPNRAQIVEALAEAQSHTARRHRWGALLFVDLDQFKLLNDTKGHHAGDRLLREVAERLRSAGDRSTVIGRFGGDEFVVIYQNLGPAREAAERKVSELARRVLDQIGRSFEFDGLFFETTASIGVAMFMGAREAPDDLLRQADLAMYRAKAAGMGQVRFFEAAMLTELAERIALRRELREATEKDELLLHYQPQLDELMRCMSAEALLRWRHPKRGMIGPAEFLWLAEPGGLGVAIDAFVLGQACATLRRWRDNPAMSGIGVAVNITAHQLGRPEFIGTVSAALQSAGVDASLLTLELTEHVMLDDMATIVQAMKRLKAIGVRIALDDFGTGYSSLTHLKQLPLDAIKIDRSFVRDLDSDPSDRAIVGTILSFADSLNLSAVAEGVETEVQLKLLRQLGCRRFQGFLFARPMPLEEIEAFVAANAAGGGQDPPRLTA